MGWLTPPPPVDRQNHGWMDRQVSKHYLPHPSDAGGNNDLIYLTFAFDYLTILN